VGRENQTAWVFTKKFLDEEPYYREEIYGRLNLIYLMTTFPNNENTRYGNLRFENKTMRTIVDNFAGLETLYANMGFDIVPHNPNYGVYEIPIKKSVSKDWYYLIIYETFDRGALNGSCLNELLEILDEDELIGCCNFDVGDELEVLNDLIQNGNNNILERLIDTKPLCKTLRGKLEYMNWLFHQHISENEDEKVCDINEFADFMIIQTTVDIDDYDKFIENMRH
jgi:hypothetical protein